MFMFRFIYGPFSGLAYLIVSLILAMLRPLNVQFGRIESFILHKLVLVSIISLFMLYLPNIISFIQLFI